MWRSMQIFSNTPGNGNAIISGCSSANFIQQYQAAGRDIINDGSRFIHLHHKCDSPPLKLSDAPTRVNILSVNGIFASLAGTKLPDMCH